MALIDVHNHILSKTWVELLASYGGHRYQTARDPEGRTIVLRKGARFLGLTDAMFDPEMRLRAMDEVGVAIELLSYTCPNCYWADGRAAETVARAMNDHLADVCARWPDRFRGLGSVPLQDVDLALKELERAVDQLGMVGLIVLANVNETPLDDPRFEPFWAALNERRLPVLLHPTVPPGVEAMGMDRYGLVPTIGFMIDTTLAVTRMILAGIFERYPEWPLIVGHTGATLPFIAGRLDQCHRFIPETRARLSQAPSTYLKRLYYDTVCYDEHALELAYKLAGPERLLYGSDYPHTIGDMAGCARRIEALPIPEAEKELIRSGNARRLFGLASR
ncbi:MAG TPA: amidohydrolase family protein [Methylomirabilota bacterium]|nr:amidohydrolase family protein [Methylomirabilota bacterium]